MRFIFVLWIIYATRVSCCKDSGSVCFVPIFTQNITYKTNGECDFGSEFKPRVAVIMSTSKDENNVNIGLRVDKEANIFPTRCKFLDEDCSRFSYYVYFRFAGANHTLLIIFNVRRRNYVTSFSKNPVSFSIVGPKSSKDFEPRHRLTVTDLMKCGENEEMKTCALTNILIPSRIVDPTWKFDYDFKRNNFVMDIECYRRKPLKQLSLRAATTRESEPLLGWPIEKGLSPRQKSVYRNYLIAIIVLIIVVIVLLALAIFFITQAPKMSRRSSISV